MQACVIAGPPLLFSMLLTVLVWQYWLADSMVKLLVCKF